MQQTADVYYLEIAKYYAEEKNLSWKLPEDLVNKILYVINHGNNDQKLKTSEYFICSILDGKVPGYSCENGVSLITSTFQTHKKNLPEKIYYRLLTLAVQTTQEKAVKYVLLAFKFGFYNALLDLSTLLLTDKIFKQNTAEYIKIFYDTLLLSLKEKENHFISVVFHLLKNVEANYDELFEDSINLLENAMQSEYWEPLHTELLKEVMLRRAGLHESDAILNVNARLNLIDEQDLLEKMQHPFPSANFKKSTF